MLVAVAVDDLLVGNLVLADQLRSGTAGFLAGVRRQGISRILLATGDRRAVAQSVSGGLGLDAVRADLTPDQKVLLVLSERKNGPVMMVGDGVNDAPALAAADIGVAMEHEGGSLRGGCRRRPAGRRSRPAALRVGSGQTITPHCARERRRRHWSFNSRNGCGGPWLPHAGSGRATSGGDRRYGDPERFARTPDFAKPVIGTAQEGAPVAFPSQAES